ncbi:MAG: TusE/DsrC/DsvC family sulfur relay protein [Flavobacteriaceae bacterium]|nr:TusE/DsrC/DsvC family sulfur relay protein [Flavobacteriaceae bacterium]
MELNVAGKTINLTDDGYLTNLSQWDKEVALAIAKEEEVELTDAHFKVIEWVQTQFKNGVSLSVRGVKSSGVVDIKEFYALFPGGPLKKATRIAGIPKPQSCI